MTRPQLKTVSKTLATAAIGGLLAGTASMVGGCSMDQDHGSQVSTPNATGQHACKGQNACKGQGGCKTADHACKGQNACKGQGGCKTM